MADTPPTPAHVLQRAYEIGREVGLQYVYVGNLPGNQTESTFCPGCGKLVIERSGYWLGKRHLTRRQMRVLRNGDRGRRVSVTRHE